MDHLLASPLYFIPFLPVFSLPPDPLFPLSLKKKSYTVCFFLSYLPSVLEWGGIRRHQQTKSIFKNLSHVVKTACWNRWSGKFFFFFLFCFCFLHVCLKGIELFWGKENFILLTFVMALIFEDCELFQVTSNLETEFLKKMIIKIWFLKLVTFN